jgi:putative transposase
MPQTGFFAQVLEGSTPVFAMAVSGKETVRLSILNYMVTSNHVHLLVVDTGKREVIPKSMQLVAGRTGQEYNQRKNRKGAYWEAPG